MARIFVKPKIISKSGGLKSRASRIVETDYGMSFEKWKRKQANEIRRLLRTTIRAGGFHPCLRNAIVLLNKLPFCVTVESNRQYFLAPGKSQSALETEMPFEEAIKRKKVYYRSPFILVEMDDLRASRKFYSELKSAVESVPNARVSPYSTNKGKPHVRFEIITNSTPGARPIGKEIDNLFGRTISGSEIPLENERFKKAMKKAGAVCKRWGKGTI